MTEIECIVIDLDVFLKATFSLNKRRHVHTFHDKDRIMPVCFINVNKESQIQPKEYRCCHGGPEDPPRQTLLRV